MAKTAQKKEKGSATLLKVFKTIMWPRRRILLLGLGVIVVNRLAGMVLPWGSKVLIDEVIVQQDMVLLKYLLLVTGSAIVIQAGTSYLLTMILSVEAQHLIAKLRTQVQRHIVGLPLSFF